MKFTLTESNIKVVERSVIIEYKTLMRDLLHLGFKIGAWGGVGLKQTCFVFLLALSFSGWLVQLFILVAFLFGEDLLMSFFIDFSILGRDKLSDQKSMYFDAMSIT